MSAASIAAAGKANRGAESPCTSSEADQPITQRILRVAHQIWRFRTGPELALRTGVSERMCRYWLAERYDISADALAALLRSEEGLLFLEALIGDARPAWWRRFKRSVRLAELRAQLERQRAEIEQLELFSADDPLPTSPLQGEGRRRRR